MSGVADPQAQAGAGVHRGNLKPEVEADSTIIFARRCHANA